MKTKWADKLSLSLREQALELCSVEPPPKGWEQAKDIAKREGMAENTARRMLNALVDAGKWEEKKWRIMRRDGRADWTRIFRRRP